MVSSNLQNAVKERNIEDIRGGLWACIVVDPSLSGKFKESLEFCKQNGISESEIFEADDGETFASVPTRENFDNLGGMLRINFSRKKIEALGNIGRVLYPPQSQTQERQKDEPCRNIRNISHREERETANSKSSNWLAGAGGAVFGGVCGAVLGGVCGAVLAKVAFDEAVALVACGAVGAAAGAFAGMLLSKSRS